MIRRITIAACAILVAGTLAACSGQGGTWDIVGSGSGTVTVTPVTTGPATTAPPTTAPAPTTTAPPTTTPPTTAPPAVWPGPSNTGVPAGTVLHPDTGGTADVAGLVIDGADFTGTLFVTAPNVVVKRSRFRVSGSGSAIVSRSTGLVIEDVEIDGLGGLSTAIYGPGWTGRRLNIHGSGDGPRMESNTVLEDSWVHDLAFSPGDHPDAIQLYAGAAPINNVTIRRNWLENLSGNRVILMADGSIDGVTVANNMLVIDVIPADPYGIAVQFTPNNVPTSWTVSGNRFDLRGGSAALYPGGVGVWTGNTTVGGAPVTGP